jgi:uncharacterized repeat protein (TIGR02543 family)
VTVSFNSNGGSTVENKTVTFDSAYGTLAEPTKTGYTFAGWYAESELTTSISASTIVKNEAAHTLYAA